MLLSDFRVKISQGILNSQALAKRYDKTGVQSEKHFQDMLSLVWQIVNYQKGSYEISN
jgi:hypothetical protein